MLVGPSSGQQVQPQTPLLQISGTQAPLVHIWPQPHAGVQVFCGQRPFVQAPPPGQPQVPPHPSLAPQVPSCGQWGVQQVPCVATVPLGQAQVPPQLFGLPFCEPSGGQIGWQQAPL